MQDFHERLEAFVATKHPSNRVGQTASYAPFEASIGVSNSTINKAINNKTSIKVDSLLKIARVYPDLNMNWLIKGEGYMLKASNNQQNTNEGEGTQVNQQTTGENQTYIQGNSTTNEHNNEGGGALVELLMKQLEEKESLIKEQRETIKGKDKRIEELTNKLIG